MIAPLLFFSILRRFLAICFISAFIFVTMRVPALDLNKDLKPGDGGHRIPPQLWNHALHRES
jgi:hypothetical protein